MTDSNPIGIFDSGVGGLSVARCIREQLPAENLLYIADSFYAPYGEKSEAFIQQRCTVLVNYLLDKNAKAIVVACNTATVSAIKTLRLAFKIPIIGIEPGVKPAVTLTKTGIVGVLATQYTINSPAFTGFVSGFSGKGKVELQACPGLVEQVEKLDLDGPKTRELVKQYVGPLVDRGVDTIVLGCTHYNFLSNVIQEIAGSHIEIIDTSRAVAKEVGRRLDSVGLLLNNKKLGDETFWTSGDKIVATHVIGHLWGKSVAVSKM